jgi:hypothetical protein
MWKKLVFSTALATLSLCAAMTTELSAAEPVSGSVAASMDECIPQYGIYYFSYANCEPEWQIETTTEYKVDGQVIGTHSDAPANDCGGLSALEATIIGAVSTFFGGEIGMLMGASVAAAITSAIPVSASYTTTAVGLGVLTAGPYLGGAATVGLVAY